MVLWMDENFKVIDNYLMVKMPQEVDHHKSGYISKTADDYIMKEGVGNVVFDFEDTRFMDSSGIGVLIGRCKKMGYGGGEVVAEHLSERIQKIFVVSGLHKMIRVAPQTMDDGRN